MPTPIILAPNLFSQSTSEKIYVGGFFTTYKGQAYSRVIRLNTDGSPDTSFTPLTFTGNGIYALAVDPTTKKLYVGGQFTAYGGQTNNYIIRLNTDGTKDTTFDNTTGFDNSVVYALAVDADGKLYVGGTFQTYKGVAASGIIRLNSNGSRDTGFNMGTGFSAALGVNALKIDANGKIYAGGGFSTYQGVAANGIIRLNPDGTKDTGFDNSTGFDSTVYGIDIDSNGKIYVVGWFTAYKGATENYIIRLNPNGTKDTGFDNSTGFGLWCQNVKIDNAGKIYVGGHFSSYKSVAANYIIRLNPDGTKDTGFDNSTGFNTAPVNTLAVDSNNDLFAGGAFTAYKSNTANRFIKIKNTGTGDVTFSTGSAFNDAVYSVVIDTTTTSVGSPNKAFLGTGGQTVAIIGGSTGPIPYTVQLLTTVGSGNWTKPAGITEVVVECWGGGGAGGGATTNNSTGNGGVGAQYAKKTIIYPSAQQSISYSVAASVAGTTGNGATGNDTTWDTNVVVAKGGTGGLANQTTGTFVDGTTVGGVGDIVYQGGGGAGGAGGLSSGGGGGGAGSTGPGQLRQFGVPNPTTEYGGEGGEYVQSAGDGLPGSNYGGGGSGAFKTTTTNRSGGAGAQGLIRISYR